MTWQDLGLGGRQVGKVKSLGEVLQCGVAHVDRESGQADCRQKENMPAALASLREGRSLLFIQDSTQYPI